MALPPPSNSFCFKATKLRWSSNNYILLLEKLEKIKKLPKLDFETYNGSWIIQKEWKDFTSIDWLNNYLSVLLENGFISIKKDWNNLVYIKNESWKWISYINLVKNESILFDLDMALYLKNLSLKGDFNLENIPVNLTSIK